MQEDADAYDQAKMERQLSAVRRDKQQAEHDERLRQAKSDPLAEPAKFIEEIQMRVYGGAGNSGETLESRVQKYAARRQRGNADEQEFL